MDRFESVYGQDLEQGILVILYYDRVTKVMYQFAGGDGACGLCPLYNADGSLMLYDEN